MVNLDGMTKGSLILARGMMFLFHGRKVYGETEYIFVIDSDGNIKVVAENEIKMFFTPGEMESMLNSTEGEWDNVD